MKYIKNVMVGTIAICSLFSCSSELSMKLPPGAKGLSSYEEWLKELDAGLIDWDRERDEANYFLYLKGKAGEDGTNGISAYQLWVEMVLSPEGLEDPHHHGQQWSTKNIGYHDFWIYLTGAPGEDGHTPVIGPDGNWWLDGELLLDGTGNPIPARGRTPYIGPNDNWWLGNFDTGVPARGQDGSPGKDGLTPEIGPNDNWWFGSIDTGIPARGQDGIPYFIGPNDNWWFGSIDTGIPARGQDGAPGNDGLTPTIGDNGNWWFGNIDTGVTAHGQAGRDGYTPNIGDNGNWFIQGEDTGVPAFGTTGAAGMSAYQLWKAQVERGLLADPHNPGFLWPVDHTTEMDFWEYLRGEDGKDGGNVHDGTTQPGGETGESGDNITIVRGIANVIPQYVIQVYNEFVRWQDGSVAYMVYDDMGRPASGAQVKGLPGVKNPNKVYTTGADGVFIIPKEDLPDNLPLAQRRGTAVVTYTNSKGDVVTEKSAPNAYVPNRMLARLNMPAKEINLNLSFIDFSDIIIERSENGGTTWKQIPSWLGDLTQRIYALRLSDNTDPASFPATFPTVITPTPTTPISEFSFWFVDLASPSPTYPTGFKSMEIDISKSHHFRLFRLREAAPHHRHPQATAANHLNYYEWRRGGGLNGTDHHYFTFVLNDYYGEKPYLNAVIRMAPIQPMPFLSEVVAHHRVPQGNFNDYFTSITGKIDASKGYRMGVDEGTFGFDSNLFFLPALRREDRTAYDYYEPVVGNSLSTPGNHPQTGAPLPGSGTTVFRVLFAAPGGSGQSNNVYGSVKYGGTENVGEWKFEALLPFINASIHMQSDTHYFYPFGQVGTFAAQTPGDPTTLRINRFSSFSAIQRAPFNGWDMFFPSIPSNAYINVGYED